MKRNKIIEIEVPEEFEAICYLLSTNPTDFLEMFIGNVTANIGRSGVEERLKSRQYISTTFDNPFCNNWRWLNEFEDILQASISDDTIDENKTRDQFITEWKYKYGF